jgi:diguanylate cyclase
MPTILDTLTQAESKNALAWDLRNTDARQALALTEEAFSLLAADYSLPTAESFAQARSLQIAGICLNRLSRYDEAMEKTEEALRLYTSLEAQDADTAKDGQALAFNNMGNIQYSWGEMGKALKCHEQSMRLKEERCDISGRAISLNNMGNVYHELGDYARALECHLESLRIRESLGDLPGQQSSQLNLGRVYHIKKQSQQALECSERSYALSVQLGYVYEQALALNNMGIIHSEMQDYSKARELFERSLTLFEEMGDPSGVASVLSDIGIVLGQQGDPAKSLEYHERSEKIILEVGNQLYLLGPLYNQAAPLKKLGRTSEAITVLNRTLAIAEELAVKRVLYSVHEELSKIYEEQNNFERAFYHIKQYQAVKEQVYSEEADQKLRNLQVLHEVEQARKEAEIYRLRNLELSEANEALLSATETLEQHAHTDGLTGVFNRRYLDQALTSEWERVCQQEGHSLTVALADIDHFKQINDRFNHQTGDVVLQSVAAILRSGVRDGDIVARYGGEEFVLLLPHTSQADAVAICERIRTVIEASAWSERHPGLQVTMSFGVATGDRATTEDATSLLHTADTRLYAAKQSGRNQVVSGG